MGRLATIMGTTNIHTSDQIKTEYIARMETKYGKGYMKWFYRPAYMGTPLEQKDIHGVRED